MRAVVSVTYKRDDGVTVSRECVVESSVYDRSRSVAAFKKRVRARAIEAVNAVLGTPKGVEVIAP